MQTLILAEIRIIFRNKEILAKVLEMKDRFVDVHKGLQNRIQDDGVGQAVGDLFKLIGEE